MHVEPAYHPLFLSLPPLSAWGILGGVFIHETSKIKTVAYQENQRTKWCVIIFKCFQLTWSLWPHVKYTHLFLNFLFKEKKLYL